MNTALREQRLAELTTLLQQTIEALHRGGPRFAAPVAELADLVTRPPRVAVVGRLKSGKSTLVNALTEHRIAATGSLECTMAVSMYAEGAPARAEILGLDGRVDTLPLPDGPVTELSRPLDEIDHIRQYLPNARLRELTLIDTPGTATLTVANEARTRRVLIDGAGDTRRASRWADCVVFLSDSAPREDERRFLTELGMTPMTTVGVLSRADSFGAGAFGRRDPLAHAREHAGAIAEQLAGAVSGVVPLSGFLAESALTGRVTGDVARRLAVLAHLGRDELLDVVELADPGRIVTGFTAADRDELLDVLGEYGIMAGRAIAARDGGVGLLRWMREVSGIDELAELLTGELRYFAVLQRAVRVLEMLAELAHQPESREHARWVQSILLAQPGIRQVLLYRAFRDTVSGTPGSRLIPALRRAVTAQSPAGVIGLPEDAPVEELRAGLHAALGEFRELAMSPLSAAEDHARELLIVAHQSALKEITPSR